MDRTKIIDDRYRLIVDAIGTGVWDWNTLTGEAYFNEGYYKVLGYDNGAFQSNYDTWRTLVHPDDIERVEANLQESVSSAEKFDIELRMKTKMGMWLWVLTSGKVIEKNPENKATRIVGTLTNISVMKTAEESILRISERLSLAVRAGGVGIWDWDVVNNIMVWDDQMYNLYGIKKEDFSGAYDAWQKGLHPDDKNRGHQETQMALRGEANFDTEFRVVWPNGTIHNIRGIAIVQRDSDGKPTRMIGTNWDITKIKEAEEKFSKLTENVPGLIFQFTRRTDGSYFVPIASMGIKDIFGCSPEDVTNDFGPITNVIFPEDSARVIGDIETSAKNMTFFTCEFRVQIPGKSIQWVYCNSRPEKLSDGAITWYGYNYDITDRKNTEELLKKESEILKESERDLKVAQEVAKIGSWKWNLVTKEILWSDEMYKIFGIDKKTYKGRLGDVIANVIHPDDLHLVLPENAPSFSNVKPVEYRIILPDKSIRYISALSGESIKNSDGEITFMVGTAQDITEKKKVEKDILDKANELERMNKLMVDREIKMIELKKELEILGKTG